MFLFRIFFFIWKMLGLYFVSSSAVLLSFIFFYFKYRIRRQWTILDEWSGFYGHDLIIHSGLCACVYMCVVLLILFLFICYFFLSYIKCYGSRDQMAVGGTGSICKECPKATHRIYLCGTCNICSVFQAVSLSVFYRVLAANNTRKKYGQLLSMPLLQLLLLL